MCPIKAQAEKTNQVLELYEYETYADDSSLKQGELKTAKEKYEDLLREVQYLNTYNAEIEKVDVSSIIDAKVRADNELSSMEKQLMQATDLDVSDILALESDINSQRTKCRVLAEEVQYIQSLYVYDVPTDKVSEALSEVAVKAREYDEAVKYGEIGDVSNVKVPLRGQWYKTSDFGIRIDPLTGVGYDNHRGVDLAASTGTPIVALFSGTVVVSEWHWGMGNYVRIDHGDGIVSTYLHMSKTDVKVGDKVKQYDKIGEVGSTGTWSTGPHLHLALTIDGTYVDPYKLFER